MVDINKFVQAYKIMFGTGEILSYFYQVHKRVKINIYSNAGEVTSCYSFYGSKGKVYKLFTWFNAYVF